MSPDKPTAADRIRRGSPATQTTSATGGPARVKPYRITVDLDPADYEHLREWAHTEHATHSGVLRALVRLLHDESVAQQVRNSVEAEKGR
jgi:hypothetical protein